ncbi:lipoprotein [Geotalea uraniireducens]|uniref:Lipoprotein n=1 Tax=Geotalea uraniireducens TaxID=351604 RepID=A0ABN6VWP9_9BACT|nr:hypothetical protein [Geotalea uraniireducens]BDV44803.1 lipoprotein [Geotalea uraniireducens]
MVTSRLSQRGRLRRLIPLFLLPLLFTAGCGPKPQLTVAPAFKPVTGIDSAYIVPFAAVLVPDSFNETVFNDFVDQLNRNRRQVGAKSFLILKEEVKDVDPAWLARQYYISGEIWSYVEDSGCCSTNIRVKARVYLHEPGQKEPSVEIFVPLEAFFDHDKSTLEREQDRLAHNLARELSQRLLAVMATAAPR